ncbi:hypothetical protein F2Q70_00017396 [Brassica cretica]|uniref:Uncharacterized protein n=1 Tax=Brassica cretica TaxID=69181 RepID=A0A8S9I352_BRACR|nr:hypothetical protein F2Q70_00017396 [Brassica cretica]
MCIAGSLEGFSGVDSAQRKKTENLPTPTNPPASRIIGEKWYCQYSGEEGSGRGRGLGNHRAGDALNVVRPSSSPSGGHWKMLLMGLMGLIMYKLGVKLCVCFRVNCLSTYSHSTENSLRVPPEFRIIHLRSSVAAFKFKCGSTMKCEVWWLHSTN